MNSHLKIRSFSDLVDIATSAHVQKKKVVLCHGCFDLLHIGHIRYLRQAKSMGDILLVTLSPDKYVDKGPNRPAFDEHLRAEALASLDCVDYVAINEWPTAEESIRLLKPSFYVKGSDFKSVTSDPTGKLALEERIVKETGGELVLTKDIVFSSTNLINRFFNSNTEDVQQYLHLFRHRYDTKDIFSLLERMASLRILILGDTIIDDYRYCSVIGASSKDPVLTLQYQSKDVFAGGVLAIANHLSNFSNNVRLTTVLGEIDSREDYIRDNLHSTIRPHFLYQKGAPTIVKRRFLEGYSTNKLFEVYVMNGSGINAQEEAQYLELLEQELPEYDMVIAADFGHGAITKRMRHLLSERAPFLAVNTQANAGNKGFHTVSCYPKADFISLTEVELRLETRDRRGDVTAMARETAQRLNAENLTITQGKTGCLVIGPDGSHVKVPAFAAQVLDRIGCGDAFFSVAAMAAYLEAPPEIIGFIGNVAGGLAAEIIGNEKPIDMMSMQKYITALLK
jgi:rfaE bifunctional protein nucleotidyltransferase chain/domain